MSTDMADERVEIPEDDYGQLASMQSTVTYLEPLLKNAEATA